MSHRLFAAIAILAAFGWAGCTPDEFAGEISDNQPPRVWLSAAPPEGSTGNYTVQLFWGGWDPDGEVSHYEYLITSNTTGVFDPADTTGAAWMPVHSNDSTFTFTADQLSNPATSTQVSEFTRSHTFFIRAIDREGLRSPEPAHRSFTARTLSPRVSIEIPTRNGFTPAEVPPIATYRWVATDYVHDELSIQEPDSVQWALVNAAPFGNDLNATLAYLRTPAAADEWHPWVFYRAPGDSGKSWTTPPQDFGQYIFAIRAKDEAGAVTPVLEETTNVRRIRVSRRTTGPLMTVRNIYIGQVKTTSCQTPLTILDLPAGVPAQFEVSADASFYGGTVAGYRYGWDIPDLNDPDQWEVDLTPFVGASARIASRSFYFGTHTLTIEVIDNSGFCSRVEVKVNIVQFTLERNLLVVDDFRADESNQAGWNNTVGQGAVPNDFEHDSFWIQVLADVDGFDPARDLITTTGVAEIPLTVLASYKSIIWSVYGTAEQRTDLPLLYSYIQHRSKEPDANSSSSGTKVTPNVLALTMSAGGHILLTGNHPVQHSILRIGGWSPRFPLLFLYELEGAQGRAQTPDIDEPVGDESFPYKELCLETMDYALTTNQRRRAQQQFCPITFVRIPNANSLRDDTMREAVPIDPRFPRLELRPEAAANGKFYELSRQGVESEVYNPEYFRNPFCLFVPPAVRPCFEPIYGLGCLDTAERTYMQPVAFFTSAFADRVAEVPGAVGARSVVWGFAPVFFKPAQVKPALEVILFDEWRLPRRPETTASE